MSEVFTCPKCDLTWKKVQLKRSSTVPVVTNLEWTGFKSKESRRSNSLVVATIRTDRPPTQREVERIKAIEDQAIPWWVPTTHFDVRGPQYRRNALSARRIISVNDLFFKRNLRALSLLWSTLGASTADIRPLLHFVFTGILHRASRLNRLRPSGAGDPQAGTIYVSSLVREENVGRLLTDKAKAVASAFDQLPTKRSTSPFLVSVGHAGTVCGDLVDVVDYVFCDPPFGSNIYYSEVNLLWEAWLGSQTNASDEAVVHRKNDGGTKRLPDYSRLMQESFIKIYRLLKPGRFATVEFNNSDGQVFEAIKQAVRDAGFVIENMVFLDKVQKTFKQVKGEKGEEDVVGHDVIFNLRKPAVISARSDRSLGNEQADGGQLGSSSNEGVMIADRTRSESLELLVADTVRQHLSTLPDRIKKDAKTYSDEHRTTPFLNTMLMKALIPKGVNVERLNLPFIESVCARYFRRVDNRWFLPEKVVTNSDKEVDRGLLFQAPTQEGEIRDETTAIAWLRRRLGTAGMRIGDLRPHWMRATVKLTGDISTRLEQFLREHFWLDRHTRRWRLPTEDELAQMDDTEQRQARHEAERFLAGTLRRHPDDRELLEWIEHLYRSATRLEEEALGLVENGQAAELPDDARTLYSMMCRLLSSVLKEHVDPSRYALAQRQCRIAATKVIAQSERDRESQAAALAADEDLPLFANLESDE